jgi:large subunit ribosomal protein L30
MADKTIKLTLVQSPFGKLPKHRATIKGLGLRKIGQTVELEDTPSVRGMVNKVNYMLRVEGE